MAGKDNAASAPLMRDSQDEAPIDSEFAPTQQSGKPSPSTFIWALTFAAGISGLLFGYEYAVMTLIQVYADSMRSTGVISSTLVSIQSDLGRPLSTVDKSLITSCTSLGALVASPVTGDLADRFGRKKMILVADLLFIAGALLQTVSQNVPDMVFGRAVIGFAVGGASLVVPMFISELSPAAYRGKLVTLTVLFITFGQVVSYFIGYALSMRQGGWRWMVGLGSVPAFIQFGLMIMLPESPRWLVKAGNSQVARKVLRDVYTVEEDAKVEEVLSAIKTEIAEEEATSDEVTTAITGNKLQGWLIQFRNRFAQLFYVGGNRRALTIACMLQGLQQLCGFVRLPLLSCNHPAADGEPEFADVFLCHDFLSPELLFSYSNFPFRCNGQLCMHAYRTFDY